jgi:zona occludens toxin (predicted ATPase)
VAYFIIFEALKSGRIVVTNLEGMEPLEIIAQRFDIETTKLIRIFSRDNDGVELWQDFFSPKVELIWKNQKQTVIRLLSHAARRLRGLFHSRHILR